MDKKKLLLVDDEETLLITLKDALEFSDKYEVRTVQDSTKALDAVREFRPDLVVLDVMMPDMDGGEVAAAIWDDPTLKDTPILFQTAVLTRDEETKHHGQSGREHFIVKPATVEELMTAIDGLL
jgi:CheY-like chemotaxis protein